MTDNELLLALSNIIQAQIEPVKNDICDIKTMLENEIQPRLRNIESCYTATYRRYQSGISHLEAIQTDISIMKHVVQEHSKTLQQLA